MLDQHRHLLLSYKTLEVLPRLILVDLSEDRLDAIPDNTPSAREQIFHEGALAGNLHLDTAVTKTVGAAAEDASTVTLHGTHGIVECFKLGVRVHRLAGHTLHDDMNRLIRIGEDPSRAAEERDDLGASGREGDL